MYISTSMSSTEGMGPTASCPAAKKQRPRTDKTILLAVKLTAFFLLIGYLHLSARTIAQQRFSITLKGATLEKAFSEIEKRSGFTVFYNVEVLKVASTISIDIKDATIEDVMRQCLKGLPLEFTVQEKTIFVKKEVKKILAEVHFGPSDPAPKTVSGIVKSIDGQPLAGATIIIPRLKKTWQSDGKGEFSIKGVPDGQYELNVSFIGYERFKTTITVTDHAAWVDAAMKASSSQLDETVVKGYYNTTNRLNTGDVTTVKGEIINEQPVTDPILALEGRVPGLYIQQASGAPGAYSTIQIMGQNSIANGNDPLYIIDGVPFSSVSLTSTSMNAGALSEPASSISNLNGGGLSPFNGLNPADIDNIEVLKDADATAIYGSRGANGVILITTKRGKAGATRLDMNVYNGGGKPTRAMHLLNTHQYLAMRREAFYNDGLPVPSIVTNPSDNNYDINGFWDTTRYTNWQKALIGNNANFTNAQASISGGNPNTQFIVGAGYSKQATLFIGHFSDQKASANINLTHASADQRLHMQIGASYVYGYNNLPSEDFTSAVTLAPDAPALYDGNGNVNWAILNGTATFGNPEATTLQRSKAASTNLISNLNVSYQIISGLQFKVNAGYNKEEMNQTLLKPAAAQPPPLNTVANRRSITFANTAFNTWIIEPQLNYQHKIGGGRLELLVGCTFQQNEQNSITQYSLGFASDALINDPLAGAIKGIDGFNSSLYRYDALYGRLGYNFDEKYLFNLTARRDGSSRFGYGKQFGNFGAAGIAWIFSKESFVQYHFPLLSFGKLRASYGITGSDQIPDYQFLSTYAPGSTTYEGSSGLSPTGLTNPYFAWEVDKKLQIGLDIGFVKDRLLISGTYYRNRTGNQLVQGPLPYVTGFTYVVVNLPALVQNTGVEFTIKTSNIKSTHFNWTTSANLTLPSNKLVAFPDIANSQYQYTYVVGKSLFSRPVYHYIGVNPQTGIYSFTTKNANGQPSEPQDLVNSKPITQKLYGGIENSFSYKDFKLDIFIQYVNQLGYNYQYAFGNPPGFVNENQPTQISNRWELPGSLTNIQRFGTTFNSVYNAYSNLQRSDGVITNASFLRLKNLALSYALPGNWKGRMHLQNARIYLQCQNLFTITRYPGLDPEVGGLSLPPVRMITGGLQVAL